MHDPGPVPRFALPQLLQGVGLFVMGGGVITVGMLAAYMVTAVSLNLTQVLFYRRSGLVDSVLVRQADYLVWHIVYGNFLHGALF